MMKKIALLGSTGSIGKSVLDIVQKQTSFFSICGLSCYQNTAELKKTDCDIYSVCFLCS